MRVAACLAAGAAALAAASTAPASPAACPGLANRLADTHGATQLVTVVGDAHRRTHASLELWQRSGDGCWRRSGGPWTARVGRGGLSDRKREGDGATPTGAYRLGTTVYGVAPDPGLHLAYRRLACGDWWDEDPASPTYNTFQHVACGARPRFGGGSEALWRQTRAYRHFAVIEVNADPVVPGRGSAIFLHADVGGPTNGCVSLPAPRLLALLRWLRVSARPLIAIGAADEIRRF